MHSSVWYVYNTYTCGSGNIAEEEVEKFCEPWDSAVYMAQWSHTHESTMKINVDKPGWIGKNSEGPKLREL